MQSAVVHTQCIANQLLPYTTRRSCYENYQKLYSVPQHTRPFKVTPSVEVLLLTVPRGTPSWKKLSVLCSCLGRWARCHMTFHLRFSQPKTNRCAMVMGQLPPVATQAAVHTTRQPHPTDPVGCWQRALGLQARHVSSGMARQFSWAALRCQQGNCLVQQL